MTKNTIKCDTCPFASILRNNFKNQFLKRLLFFHLLPSQYKLNMESLTKPELLMLFSILEGELEARDLVIDTLKVTINEASNIIRTFE